MRMAFGFDDYGYSCLGAGWSFPEGSSIWAVGSSSRLIIPAIWHSNSGYVLNIDAYPYSPHGEMQHLHITCNGLSLGVHELPDRRNIRVTIESGVLRGPVVNIEITPKYWTSPASIGAGGDQRDLSFCLLSLEFSSDVSYPDKIERSVEGLSDCDLMMKFESLADDCEFGFAQRAHGANPISLFRFGGLRLHRLHEVLLNRFKEVDNPENISVLGHVGYDEYTIRNEYYKYAYHTFVVPTETNREKVFNDEVRRLRFCKRKLIEDLEDGEKIFVVKTSSLQGAKLEQIVDTARLIAEYGASTLFWVTRSDEQNPPGTLKWHTPNLLEGRIDRLCEPGLATLYSSYWLPLCRRAYKAVNIRKMMSLPLPVPKP